MKLLFWLCFLTTAYTYFGYVLWLRLEAAFRRRPVRIASTTPTVSVLMAVRNEQQNLPAKLRNLKSLNYPSGQIQIVVASDGSTDSTAEILLNQVPDVLPVILQQSNGKSAALNASVRVATGEILVFLDVRQAVDPDAITELVSCFADPTVGAVSGELLLETAPGVSADNALGIYWKIEKIVRRLESASGSVVGVTGAIYAMRRELFIEIPPGTILDDVYVPMNVVKQGKRVVFQPTAIARDQIFEEKGKEFSRKVRTLTGNYQLIQLAPWLLSPANPILFRFISHKILRLLVPVLLVLMLLSCVLAAGTFYRAILLLQLTFYLLALCGSGFPAAKKFKPVAIASTFVMLNTAAAMALYNFVVGRKRVWV
jgi:biofilm PGA synthesis N-glycosyltransferase PgaC